MKKKKNQHHMKVERTGEEHTIESMSLPAMARALQQGKGFTSNEEVPDGECRMYLDMRAQMNLDRTGHPFHHRAADGTVVTPDPTISYFLSRIPMDDQEYILNMWQQYVKPDHMKAVPVDEHWYDKHPITKADLNGSSGRFK